MNHHRRFTGNQLRELAAQARIEQEDADKWERFVDLLQHGARDYGVDIETPAETKRRFRKIAKYSQELINEVNVSLENQDILYAVYRAERNIFNENFSNDKSQAAPRSPSDTLNRFRSAQRQLYYIRKCLEKAMNDPIFPQGRGQPRKSWRFSLFIYWLGEAWWTATGKRAGTSFDRETGRRRGPFIDFVKTALGFLDPPAAQRASLDRQIQDALSKANAAGARREK